MAIIQSHDITLRGGNAEFDIVLKPLCDDYLPLLYKWNSDTEVTYFTESSIGLAYDEKTVQRKYGGVSKEAFCFLIEANGVSIGECWLQKMNKPDVIAMYPKNTDIRRIDMCIGEKEYWGKGIGTLFIGMMIDFSFNYEHIDVLHCFCEDYNKRSERMWQKYGFSLVRQDEETYNPQWKSPIGKWQYHYALLYQQYRANEIIKYLSTLSEVKTCCLYGSLANGNADKYSDIDIEVDVSGSDNGAFLKVVPEIVARRFPVTWYDFAPSLAPEQYVISVAIDESNPFCVVDFKCTATPHIKIVQKSDLVNDIYIHLIKLWVVNCKHFIRGSDCTRDIRKMARRAIGAQSETMTNKQILEETLHRLEKNTSPETETYIPNLRKAWETNK